MALVFAVALVAGSVAIRGGLDNEGDGSPRRSGDGFRLMCATELREVCEQAFGKDDGIVISFENPGRTADSLVDTPGDQDPGFDAWLTADPWGQILADNRRFGGAKGTILEDRSEVLGRSPVVIAMVSKTARDQVTEACGDSIAWTCIAEHVERSGAGRIRPGVPSPDRIDGLAVAASAANSFFEPDDYSSLDLDQGGFSPFFRDLTSITQTIRLGERSVLQAAITQRGAFSVVGALEAETASLETTPVGFSVDFPTPVVTADIRLNTRKGLRSDDALNELGADRLAKALTANGWRVPGKATITGVNGAQDLPEGSNMPEPGVLQRLRDEWNN